MPEDAQTRGAFGDAHPPPNRLARRIIWIFVAVMGSALSFALSWPWHRDHSYGPESQTMWTIYFVIGFILAVYVFYVFFGKLHTLFEHDEIEREEIAARDAANTSEGQP